MSAYGYEIVQTLIVDIEPDEHVKRAMNEINAGNHAVFLFIVIPKTIPYVSYVHTLVSSLGYQTLIEISVTSAYQLDILQSLAFNGTHFNIMSFRATNALIAHTSPTSSSPEIHSL